MSFMGPTKVSDLAYMLGNECEPTAKIKVYIQNYQLQAMISAALKAKGEGVGLTFNITATGEIFEHGEPIATLLINSSQEDKP